MIEKTLNEINEEWVFLIKKAREVQKNAYAPYSNYKVGASLKSTSGKIYSGCNVEHSLYTLTTHAEVNAIDTMIASEGANAKIEFLAITIPKNSEKPNFPCGLCRAKISEHMKNPEIPILTSFPYGNIVRIASLEELYPHRSNLKVLLNNDQNK